MRPSAEGEARIVGGDDALYDGPACSVGNGVRTFVVLARDVFKGERSCIHKGKRSDIEDEQ